VATLIFSQLSLAWVTLFSASSRKAAGTSILGTSNFGRSKRGISNFGDSVDAKLGALALVVLVVVTSDMMVILVCGFPGPAFLAAPDFLDPPPRRRSGGDFIGRAKPAGSNATLLALI